MTVHPTQATTQTRSQAIEGAVALNPILHYGAFIALLALFILCIVWELWLDPIVPGGSIYFLKALPLMFPLYGVYKGNLYTMQWSSMLVLLYILEGTTRWYSDISPLSQKLGMIEFFLALIVFCFAIFYVRPAKKLAKQRKRLQEQAVPLQQVSNKNGA